MEKSKIIKMTKFENLLQDVGVFPNANQKHFCIDLILPPTIVKCNISKIIEGVIIKVKYVPSDTLLEVSSFRKAFENKHFEATFEEMVSVLYDFLNEKLMPINLYVEIEKTSENSSDFVVAYGNFK